MSLTWIEASAGTGKTYTLVQTVLGLVRDNLPVERILLVTFTEKATAELKTRIREGLRSEWKKTNDGNLARALENLASLSVTTIHGFCHGLLTQFPLESGVSFEPETVDQGRQWRRLLREELRPRLSRLDANLLSWAGLEDEEELLAMAQQALNRNLFSLPVLHPLEAEQSLFAQWRTALESGQGPLWDAVRKGQALHLPEDSLAGLGQDTITTYLHATVHKKPYRNLRAILAARSFRDLLPLLNAETLASIAQWDEGGGAWKKKVPSEIPPHLAAIQSTAQTITAAAEALVSRLVPGVDLKDFLSGCARYAVLEDLCRPVLQRRSTRELTFHDMIERVRTLVTTGSPFTAAASSRWDAVLIDEFQDTDPEQWDIFRALFADDRHQLYLVGDPKQSIYRFRGADLDVYRAVAAEVKAAGASTMVLEENFRSTEAMIEAVNSLFDPRRAPWDHPGDFTPSRKGKKEIGQLVRRTAEGLAPVPPLAVFQACDEKSWHRHLVETVVGLLDGSHFIKSAEEERLVSPGDFLVLVRQKREAWTLYRLLTARGIPAAVGGAGGLLKGREARDVLLFLKALESPRSLPAARALTWTRLFAGADLDLLVPALEEAQRDHDQGAFLRAFRRVAAALEPGTIDGGGLEPLLRRPGGARLVTNAEHVLEVVQERYHRGDIAPGQAALSLETWIQSGLQEDEVDLRRDSEIPTVRLMTVHSSKGLEAPVVLHGRPSESKADQSPWIIAGGVDFLKTEASREAEARQRSAENLRLRYVALTRARTHQVYQDAEDGSAQAVPVPSAGSSLPWVGFTFAVPTLQTAIPALEKRHPWVESHSGVWRRATRDEAARTVWDRPRVSRDDEGAAEPGIADTLPAGPVFGDLVHDLLEAADFRAWAAGAPASLTEAAAGLVESLAQRHRAAFDNRDLSKPLGTWIGRTLNHPFALDGGTPFLFSALAPDDTRRELEFHLPLGLTSAQDFHWGERLFTVHPGYLTGRIDLLFRWEGKLYLADWKTNRLQPGEAPEAVMAESGYDLQAQWYWEALVRLARLQREPLEAGGVLYVFLRGAGEEPRGVFLGPDELDRNAVLSPFFKEARHG